MHCLKCNTDLANYVCKDLAQRLEKIKSCESIFIGPDYLKRIEEQIKRNSEEQIEQE